MNSALRSRYKLHLLACLLAGVTTARADIAPSRFVGSGIVPAMETDIRMESARVEIEWGTPCTLTATFKMVNSSTFPREIIVGFPMPNLEYQRSQAPDPLQISFDGEVVEATPPANSPEERDKVRDWEWYHTRHTFSPGTTTVIVNTVQRASRNYGSMFYESLFYCIESGQGWAGSIGEEHVVIRFPAPLSRDQIFEIKPNGYVIDGNCISWRMEDIEPLDDSLDIAVTYVRPDVMTVIDRLRFDLQREPDSTAAAINLAQHLLALGFAKSNSGFPPYRLSPDEFDRLLSMIKDPEGREILLRRYERDAEGSFREAKTEWTEERVRFVGILAEIGYRDQQSLNPFVLEGERLLKEVLDREPHNAVAWKVYLGNYWRFSFAALGHWFGGTWLAAHQREAIRSAAENCPEDESIRLWLEVTRDPHNEEKLHQLRVLQEGFSQVPPEFPSIEYDYY